MKEGGIVVGNGPGVKSRSKAASSSHFGGIDGDFDAETGHLAGMKRRSKAAASERLGGLGDAFDGGKRGQEAIWGDS